jgi:hypothetical protein
MDHNGLRIIHHPPSGLVHTQTQINILRTVKNPLVKKSHLRKGRPADYLTSANDIINLTHRAVIPVRHLHFTGNPTVKRRGKPSYQLIAQRRKEATGELELAPRIDQFRSTQTHLRVFIQIGNKAVKRPRLDHRIVVKENDILSPRHPEALIAGGRHPTVSAVG